MKSRNQPGEGIETHWIIVFDGVCHFCNGAVNFIIRRDSQAKFSFVPMQSELAQVLIEKYQVANVGVDTFLLIKDEKAHVCSDAALTIASELDGYWYLLGVFKVIPRAVRDWLYRLLAKNRYSLFGRSDECMVPTPEVRDRFIGS